MGGSNARRQHCDPLGFKIQWIGQKFLARGMPC